MSITENYKKIRKDIPKEVTIVLAGKTRTLSEIKEGINAGATDIGENYVQEGLLMYDALGEDAKKLRWHMIGHLQSNKVNKALSVFDVIQTVDSVEKANTVNKRAKNIGKNVAVYIEVNIGSEITKSGVRAEYDTIKNLAIEISKLGNLRLDGLMTMGPRTGDPEEIRPYFRKTKEIFDKIKEANMDNVDMKVLSMGMSNSYKAAIEEGSNMIRLGTVVFGERN